VCSSHSHECPIAIVQFSRVPQSRVCILHHRQKKYTYVIRVHCCVGVGVRLAYPIYYLFERETKQYYRIAYIKIQNIRHVPNWPQPHPIQNKRHIIWANPSSLFYPTVLLVETWCVDTPVNRDCAVLTRAQSRLCSSHACSIVRRVRVTRHRLLFVIQSHTHSKSISLSSVYCAICQLCLVDTWCVNTPELWVCTFAAQLWVRILE
jgi:hypothetical protein